VTDAELLRRLARPAEIAHDLREQRFVEHTLQIAIQAALDVASHIVSDQRLGEPRTNRELPRTVGRARRHKLGHAGKRGQARASAETVIRSQASTRRMFRR
jgi:hypothetical protein